MIHITEQAAKQLRSLTLEKKDNNATGLRLAVEKGGCAGLQYIMTFGEGHPEDKLLKIDGARVFIDTASLAHLEKCTLDYEDCLTGSGFRIINPHAIRSCGCGTSFELKKDDENL